MDTHTSYGRTLRDFLLRPQPGFTAFYRASQVRAQAYLVALKQKGWVLPVSRNDHADALQNLACDLLTYLFLDNKGQHYRKITNYFAGQGITNFATADPDRLEEIFLPFFYKQLRQGLWRAGLELRPESHKRQKTIENILRGGDYASLPDNPDLIARRESLGALRIGANTVPRELMERIAWESVLDTHKLTDLCREFFRRLESEVDYRNFVNRREQIRVLTDAIERLALEISPIGGRIPSPEEDRQASAACLAADRAMAGVREKVIKDLLDRKLISGKEADGYCESCRLYLEDRCNGNGTDKLAAYFRAGFPDDFHTTYDKTYKHRFLKIMEIALQYYTEELDVLL